MHVFGLSRFPYPLLFLLRSIEPCLQSKCSQELDCARQVFHRSPQFWWWLAPPVTTFVFSVSPGEDGLGSCTHIIILIVLLAMCTQRLPPRTTSYLSYKRRRERATLAIRYPNVIVSIGSRRIWPKKSFGLICYWFSCFCFLPH